MKWDPYQTAPPRADEVEAWWTAWPEANVALVLGRGLFAVDLDGGAAAAALLADRGIALPSEAPRSRTANGFHVLLRADRPVPDAVGLLVGAAAPGRPKPPQIDIRGVGIIVAPPSIHPSGVPYVWEVPLQLPCPEAPTALLALLDAHAGGRERTGTAPTPDGGLGSAWVLEALRGVPEGQRDATCARLAGFLLGHGLDPATVTALLVESFARHCRPPFPAAEVQKTVDSIARRARLAEAPGRVVTPVPLGQVLDAWLATLAAGPPRLVRTPFPSLNRYLGGGFWPGELVYLGARPGVGKTALALELSRDVARGGQSVLIVSREMVTVALARRLVAQHGRIDALTLRRGALDAGDQVRVTDTVRQLRGLPIWLTDDAVTLAEITALVTRLTVTPPLGCVIVDYLQLVRGPETLRERRHQIEAVSQGLKTLAVQGHFALVCLSSLSRPSKGKDQAVPGLADLRESGELEHDADVVLFLHRRRGQGETECIVAKARDGQTGSLTLLFRPEYVAFEEPSERREPA